MSVASDPITKSHTSSGSLRIALWVAQGLLFIAFGLAGVGKLTLPIDTLAAKLPWVPRLSAAMVRFIGAAELAGALGILLPSLTRIKPSLTPLAAAGLTTVMLLAAGHHALHGEANVMGIPLVLGALATFVGWGRWKKVRIQPRE